MLPQQDRFLGTLPATRNRRRVHRLQGIRQGDFLTDLGLDPQSTEELREIRRNAGYRSDPEGLLDAPFRLKLKFREPSRFSDGSFPVFYSSLDLETAHEEIGFHFQKFSGKPTNTRTVYYQQLSCTFLGLEKDLRSKLAEWPDLTHDAGYAFCNKLGAEARETGIDGLLTPSARYEGTNLPVFNRDSLSQAQLGHVVKISLDPATSMSFTIVV